MSRASKERILLSHSFDAYSQQLFGTIDNRVKTQNDQTDSILLSPSPVEPQHQLSVPSGPSKPSTNDLASTSEPSFWEPEKSKKSKPQEKWIEKSCQQQQQSLLSTPAANRTQRNNTPSPVLTTEQLYASAQWTDLSPVPLAGQIEDAPCPVGIEQIGAISDEDDNYDDLLPNKVEKKIRSTDYFPKKGKKLNFVEPVDPFFQTPNGLSDIPSSMAEIYQLSNKNRKEKKKKKKEDNCKPLPPVQPRDLRTCLEVFKNKEEQNEDEEQDYDSSVEFMRSIGWVRVKEAPAPRPVKTNQNNKKVNIAFKDKQAPKGRGSYHPNQPQQSRGPHRHPNSEHQQFYRQPAPQYSSSLPNQQYYGYPQSSQVYPMQYPPYGYPHDPYFFMSQAQNGYIHPKGSA